MVVCSNAALVGCRSVTCRVKREAPRSDEGAARDVRLVEPHLRKVDVTTTSGADREHQEARQDSSHPLDPPAPRTSAMPRERWVSRRTVADVEPVEALRRVAFLLERENAESYRVQAYRKAAAALDALGPEETLRRIEAGRLTELAGVGPKTAALATEAASGEIPAYVVELEARPSPADSLDDAGRALLAQLRGDCHTHSDWSDGGSPPLEMAIAARDLGHEWTVLTDHSPRLTVARGLTRERLEHQLDVVAKINSELAPFRYLTGIEVDILEDGRLDQDDDLLARLDVVVASVHSKLRAPSSAMTPRIVRAIANPHVDVLGHCTGRMVAGGKSRPESEFEVDLVIEACRQFDVALEINSRPERLDPPRRILRDAVDAGLLLALDTDAHAPGQLDWQANGVARAVECGVDASKVVTTWNVDTLLDWTRRRS
jgi:putative hydrolase